MVSLPQRFIEDKALRDAAKGVLDADLAHFQKALEEQGIAGRVRAQITGKVKNRISAGARDVLEQARDAAGDHRGIIAVLVAALVLWLAREPLLSLFGLTSDNDETDLSVPEEGDADDEGA